MCAVQAASSIIVTDAPPTSTEYNYWYDIVDPSTGDTKSQHEIRQGDIVKGSYSVIDPDGTKRVVEYTADSKHGFKAVVRNEPVLHNNIAKRHYTQHYPFGSSPNPFGKLFGYPIPYAKRPQAPIFSTSEFVATEQIDYFTPGNDTSTDTVNQSFNKGEFFVPNYMHLS